jgi:hypothetical protein
MVSGHIHTAVMLLEVLNSNVDIKCLRKEQPLLGPLPEVYFLFLTFGNRQS